MSLIIAAFSRRFFLFASACSLFLASIGTLPVQASQLNGAAGTGEVVLSTNAGSFTQKPSVLKPPDKRIKVRPSLSFLFNKKGIKKTVGPRVIISKILDEKSVLRFSADYLPVKFNSASSGCVLNQYSAGFSYKNNFRRDMYYDAGVSAIFFRPDENLKNFIARSGAVIEEKNLNMLSASIAKKVFALSLGFRGKKIKVPFFLRVSYSYSPSYQYGTQLGEAGTEYKFRNGFKISLRPVLKKF